MVTEMTERRIHYHRNGGVTARLELVMPDGGDFPESFARRHADAVGAAFDGGFSKNADDAFDAARARDRAYRFRAYRFRPYTLRIEYRFTSGNGEKSSRKTKKKQPKKDEKKEQKKKERTGEMSVSYLCTSGRRVVYAGEEKHRFRFSKGAVLYLGACRS